MPLHLRPGHASHAPSASRTFAAAFADRKQHSSPIVTAFFPGLTYSQIREHYAKRWKVRCADENVRTVVVVDDELVKKGEGRYGLEDDESDAVIAIAVWTAEGTEWEEVLKGNEMEEKRLTIKRRETKAEKEGKKDKDVVPSAASTTANPALIKHITDGMHQEQERVLGERPKFLHLTLLGTNPSHVRRGAASMLLGWGNNIADAHQIPLWVDSTSDRGHASYSRAGYEDVGEVVTHTAWWMDGSDASEKEKLWNEGILAEDGEMQCGRAVHSCMVRYPKKTQ